MNIYTRFFPIVALLCAGSLTGCGQAVPETAITAAESAKLIPADPRIAKLYAQSCKSCHTVADSGAPLTGDKAAWSVRLQKGEDALAQSTLQGLNGMPPGGQCFACTPDDLRALTRFMAGKDGQ